MSHPCPFKVFKRIRGDSRKHMIARFAELADAVNWAIECSSGRFGWSGGNQVQVIVYGSDGRVSARFKRGIRQ